MTLYVTNNNNWANVYLYTWKGDSKPNGAWPGEKLTNPIKNSYGQDVYVIEFDLDAVEYFIINNGNGTQTADLSLADEHFAEFNNIYFTSGGQIGYAVFVPAE